ncbi:PilZ domain-containing protein [Geomesophilobacter sediminis]|uniref:PilZ domain-containing protein n=1 Tax=Geomesophilobacter sediminis TaxID=2798584 RepID=A0A8J7M168_9BACT|nr:PilZ domain-containing protein [Geomesophilobacter sediminis]MBJ6726770.1 PilZ domain-containing protein [Geomesophilobacter sediminis]
MSTYREFAGMHERRRYMRFPVDYQVKVTHRGQTTEAQLRDMSINGVFVSTTLRIPLAEAVDITIYHDDHPSRLCNLSGMVVRTTDSGLAIRLDQTLLEL